MTVEQAKQKVLDLARNEIGYHEKASNSQLNDPTANSGGANYTKYAEHLDSYAGFYNGPKNGYAWCDVFVDYLFVKCFGDKIGRLMLCQPENSAGAGCLYSAQYYKEANRWHTGNPEPGDQIFFSYSSGEYSHTGIVEKVEGDTITTIEGNTSDQVMRKTYSRSDFGIVGYGTPKWSLVEDWVVVVNGQIVNSSEWAKDEEVVPEPEIIDKEEDHGWNPGTLRRSDTYSVSVVVMQALLTARHFNCGQIDGYFGPLTEIGVNHARRYYGMKRTGVCDFPLWLKLLLMQR